jgi:hypothetical protein
MLNHDSAPILAYFADRNAADQCLQELRKHGILNEQIGVSDLGSTVLTPANDPDVYRVTGQQNSSSEIQDFEHLEDLEIQSASHFPTPNTAKFNPEHEAEEYEHPENGLMVSVSADPGQRDEIRNLLHRFGARLGDWPSANEKAA